MKFRSILRMRIALFQMATCIVGACVFWLGGCAAVKVIAGAPVDPAALENKLVIGQSTATDVERVLGPPFGKGREMLPLGESPRTAWQYYYEEGGQEDDRRLFMFVFIKDGRYDGYIWFSSLSPETIRRSAATNGR
ncbi:hypothetical protein PTE30175_01100 [Pandoraea terrae]|uniref:Lipoprotein SmpA/OmlA domain-containing protein n=1 Tax=Pandoraea terrae TaxID=1537710 RepID=A0A5E4T586_9BURK|nr:hypothetical protein [Pandoraea terrae]VVD81748.1 hypothetical protein PTE30175_01100 [Pandoraea terrae]